MPRTLRSFLHQGLVALAYSLHHTHLGGLEKAFSMHTDVEVRQNSTDLLKYSRFKNFIKNVLGKTKVPPAHPVILIIKIHINSFNIYKHLFTNEIEITLFFPLCHLPLRKTLIFRPHDACHYFLQKFFFSN